MTEDQVATTAGIPDMSLPESGVVYSADGDERAVVLQKRWPITAAEFGYLEAVELRDGTLDILGWAVDDQHEPPESVLVIVDGRPVRTSGFRQFERSDVTTHLNLAPGVKAGFAIYAHPRSVVRDVIILAAFQSGQVSELPGASYAGMPQDLPAPAQNLDYDKWRSKCSVPLVQYPDDTPFSGIFCTPSLYQQKPRGVTDQFLENADVYDKKYMAYERWRLLLHTAFKRAAVEPNTGAVLDLGSGSGNSVLPTLDLLPGAGIVATDISPQLLAILRRSLTPEQLQRCLLVVADASEKCFTTDAFDLVIGAAILHHLFDPADAIASAFQALRKGGRAIFFEPFEEGSALLRCLYGHLLDCRRELQLTSDVADVFERIILDLKVRTGTDKSDPIFGTIDDKWLFTHRYFELQQRACGFSKLEIFPLDRMHNMFSSQVATHLRLCLNKNIEALPSEAWQIVRRYDEMLSEELRPKMLMEGCVILTK